MINNIDELTNTQKIDLIKDKLFNVFLISYPQLQKEIFERLAEDEEWIIRYYLAVNPNLPASVMEILAKDIEGVRGNLARNPNLSISIMEKLAVDRDKDVRCSLAMNPNLPISVMEKLAKDEDSEVRWELTQNPDYQKYLLDKENKV